MLTGFGNEDNGWDIDDTGEVGVGLFAWAVQVWALCQDRAGVTVAEAALAFNATPECVRAAVAWHPFMFLGPADSIEHDGE